MYERSTRNIRVAVRPAFLDDQSDPDDHRYMWSYTVTIENTGPETVQLLSRYWHITDGHGQIKEVAGGGVVGA
jgi:ApaG protein